MASEDDLVLENEIVDLIENADNKLLLGMYIEHLNI